MTPTLIHTSSGTITVKLRQFRKLSPRPCPTNKLSMKRQSTVPNSTFITKSAWLGEVTCRGKPPCGTLELTRTCFRSSGLKNCKSRSDNETSRDTRSRWETERSSPRLHLIRTNLSPSATPSKSKVRIRQFKSITRFHITSMLCPHSNSSSNHSCIVQCKLKMISQTLKQEER